LFSDNKDNQKINFMFERPFTFDRVTRIIFSCLVLAGVIWLITILRDALLPFLVAWLLAYLMQPFVKFFQYKLHFKSRLLSIATVIILTIGVLWLLYILVVPSIVDEANRTMKLIQAQSANTSYGKIPFIPQAWVDYVISHVDFNKIVNYLNTENIENIVKQVAPKLWAVLTGTFSILISITVVFVVLLYFIFILLDYEKISNGWINLVPKRQRSVVSNLTKDIEYSMNRYFRGQSLIALCFGIMLAIGFSIINFPLGVILGLTMGLLDLIPYMHTLGLIPMALLSLLKAAETGQNFWVIFGLSVLVLCVVQCIQDLILTPKIMGHQMGLNPAIILLSLSIWGTLLGFIGLIIALPMTTLCLSYYKRYILGENKPLRETEPL